MKTPAAVLMSLLLASLTVQFAPAASSPEGVTAKAQTWLHLIDAGHYGQSWQAASTLFRTAVSEANWTASAQAARSPLGALVHREQASSQEAASLPGAPDGDYQILTFTTEFARKKLATETLVLMREADGQWRVAGYFIK